MAYASSADLVLRFDSREISDLLSDSGAAVDENDFATHPKLTAILDDASGEIEAALLVGKRYEASDLSGLTGNSLAHLKRITCELAMRNLLARRPAYKPELLEGFEKRCQAHLKQLRNGENVFNLEDQKDAGVIGIGGLTTVETQALNLMRDRTLNYYPRRYLPDNR
jgi:phage gp36-like protein